MNKGLPQWFEDAIIALEEDLREDRITMKEYKMYLRDLESELEDEEEVFDLYKINR